MHAHAYTRCLCRLLCVHRQESCYQTLRVKWVAIRHHEPIMGHIVREGGMRLEGGDVHASRGGTCILPATTQGPTQGPTQVSRHPRGRKPNRTIKKRKQTKTNDGGGGSVCIFMSRKKLSEMKVGAMCIGMLLACRTGFMSR